MNLIKYSLPIFVSISTLFATWFNDIPREIKQANGEIIHCFISGDQYSKRLHDENNFTIILNSIDGNYYYANLDLNGVLRPSDFQVGEGNPSFFGMEPGLTISKSEYEKKRLFYHNETSTRNSRDAPTSGEIAQLNVFIRFSDDPEFSSPRSYYDVVFQAEENEPSLRDYYWEISYNTLWVETHHFPDNVGDFNTSYQDEHPRNYYEPYSGANPGGYQNSDERTQREHTLLSNALNEIESQVPTDLDIDANDDGMVDAVSFVIYGGPGDWADLLWPHRWSLYTQNVTINGAQVWDYLFMLSESWYFNVGVLCHEFFHVLGAPDLYHYNGGGAPSAVGGWDVMEANTNPPQYPSAFMKWKYGDWLADLPEITESGTYTLNPLQQQNGSVYKIASPFSETEYFVIEYRKKEGIYEINTPGIRDGIVVYRINSTAGNGNAQGPPDEIYCYRPGGTLTNNGAFEFAPYSSDYGHTQLNDTTDPNCFLYNDGNGADGGLNLYNVTGNGETISFSVSLGMPQMDLNPEELNYSLSSGDNESQTITLSNTGEEGTQLDFDINVSGSVPFQNSQGGPDGGNYYWTSSSEEPGMAYEWVDISENMTQLTFPHNDQFAVNSIELPFDFHFFGETYSYVQVNANGWIGWNSENETAWLNEDIPSSSAPSPAIFGYWDDMNPNNDNGNASSSGNAYYHVNQNRAVIWFNDVVRWNVDDWGQFDFQIVINADGTFQTNYRNMEGVLNSGTIGFQNIGGTQGTQISSNETFTSVEYSWIADQSENDITWLILSSNTGELSGVLLGGESMDIYAQVLTSGMDAGLFTGNINFISQNTNSEFVPVNLLVSGDNSTPSLPVIDISNSENGIVYLPEIVDPIFSNIASRYTHVVTPNGDLIPFLIQDDFSVAQILHARKVLESFLTNNPGNGWGNDKTNMTNAIGASNAILFLLNDEEEYENPDLWALMDAGVDGQDLLAMEVFPEGSPQYMSSSERDASYEEILHFVHGFGIQLAIPAMQNAIISAMNNAISNNIYNPLNDLPEEDYDEEYLAMGLECYFGLWAHDPNGNGYCGDNEYSFITREAMAEGDPDLFEIIAGFVGETWEYTIDLPESVNSGFYLNFQNGLDYTHRSQYVKNINSSGESNINLQGNNFSNNLTGNIGDNHFMSFDGENIINGRDGFDRMIFQGDFDYYAILPPSATGDSSTKIIDFVPNRDGTNFLFNIEEVEFNGIVYNLNDFLDNGSEINLPTEFAIYAPYPNPFNPTTSILFDIAKTEHVDLSVFNIKGEFIKSLQNETLDRGQYSIKWHGLNEMGHTVPSGIYIIKFTSNFTQKNRKVLFLK